MVMKIGICQIKKESGEKLKKILKELEYECLKIKIFSLGENLLKSIEDVELVFLDIEMPKIDGIELGKEIEYANAKCKIIITSGNAEHKNKISYIKNVAFLLEPFEKYKVKKILEETKTSNNVNRMLAVYKNRRLCEIPQNEIHYIKTYNGAVDVMVGNQKFRKEISLRRVEDMLDDKLFYRIHRNCIVNLEQILSYEKGKVEMASEELNVSVRKRKQFEKVYMQLNKGSCK